MKFTVRVCRSGITAIGEEATDAKAAARAVVNRHPELSDVRIVVDDHATLEFTGFYLTPKRSITRKASYTV